MKRFFFTGAALIGVVWLSIGIWMIGYTSGFEDGTDSAWDQARRSFIPAQQQLASRQFASLPRDLD